MEILIMFFALAVFAFVYFAFVYFAMRVFGFNSPLFFDDTTPPPGGRSLRAKHSFIAALHRIWFGFGGAGTSQ